MKNKILLFAGLLFLLITGGAKAQVQCQAYFTYNNLQGNLYQFNDTSFTSSGNITSYSWTFGNGGTSTLANPNYQFHQHGLYQHLL
jgi:xanthomonalisin